MRISFNNNTLKVAWQESLDVMRGKTLGILLLVSLRALKDLYKALLYAWFLPIALLVGVLLELKSLLCAFYITLLVRAARPSIDLKKTAYWSQLVLADWILFFGLFAVVELIRSLLIGKQSQSIGYYLFLKLYELLLKVFFLSNFSWLPGSDTLGVVAYFLSPFVIVWALFMLDAQKTIAQYIAAFGRAVAMVVYNYPFFFVSYCALRALILLGYLVSRPWIHSSDWVPLVGWLLLFGVLIPFYVCFILSFYTKKVHEQFGLYYRT